MEDEKKIYFKYGCLKAALRMVGSSEEKEIFSKVADNQELLNEWNDEFVKISYEEFKQKYSTLTKNELDGYFIQMLGVMSPSKENIQMITNMFNILIKENLVTKAFEKDDRRSAYILSQIIMLKDKKDINKTKFCAEGAYDGLLPYLVENKRMEEYKMLLDAAEPVIIAIRPILEKRLFDFKSGVTL